MRVLPLISLLLIASSLFSTGCATRSKPYSYAAIEDEYATPDFYTTNFSGKRVLLLSYTTDASEPQQAASEIISAMLAGKLQQQQNVSDVILKNSVTDTGLTGLTREQSIQQLLQAGNDYDYVLEYSIDHWEDRPGEVVKPALCKHSGLEIGLNIVLWRVADQQLLWRSLPDVKMGSIKCVVQSDSSYQRQKTDEEKHERTQRNRDDDLTELGAAITADIVSAGMEHATYSNMKPEPAPDVATVAQQLSDLISGQLHNY